MDEYDYRMYWPKGHPNRIAMPATWARLWKSHKKILLSQENPWRLKSISYYDSPQEIKATIEKELLAIFGVIIVPVPNKNSPSSIAFYVYPTEQDKIWHRLCRAS